MQGNVRMMLCRDAAYEILVRYSQNLNLDFSVTLDMCMGVFFLLIYGVLNENERYYLR